MSQEMSPSKRWKLYAAYGVVLTAVSVLMFALLAIFAKMIGWGPAIGVILAVSLLAWAFKYLMDNE